MTLEYFRIEDSDHFNRLYGNNFTEYSGWSTIPYRGWGNRFGPPGHNLITIPDLYSTFANGGSLSGKAMLDDSRLNQIRFGPVPSVYEVTIAGITNGDNGCFDCDRYNGTYELYLSSNDYGYSSHINNMITTSINSRSDTMAPFGNDPPYTTDQILWKTHVCDIENIISPCGRFNTVGSQNITSSGNPTRNQDILLRLYQWPANTGHIYLDLGFYPSLSGNQILFKKDFGQVNSNSMDDLHKKPFLLESDHLLTIQSSGNYLRRDYVGGFIGIADAIANIGYTDVPNNCNISNATAYIKPKYFNTGYTLRQTRIQFSELNKGYTTPYSILYQSGVGISNFVYSICQPLPFYQDYSLSGLQITRRDLPAYFNLTLNNITTINNQEGCVSCEEYFNKERKLRFVSYDASVDENVTSNINDQKLLYRWVGYHPYIMENNNFNSTQNYPVFIYKDANTYPFLGKSSFNYDICSYTDQPSCSVMELELFASGDIINNNIKAVIRLGTAFNLGTVNTGGQLYFHTIYEAIVCNNNCFSNLIEGNVPCLSGDFWNNLTWTRLENRLLRSNGAFTHTDIYYDYSYNHLSNIDNYCNIDNATIDLSIPSIENLKSPCNNDGLIFIKKCAPCIDGTRPQTITATFTHPASGTVTYIYNLDEKRVIEFTGFNGPLCSYRYGSFNSVFLTMVNNNTEWQIQLPTTQLSGVDLNGIWNRSNITFNWSANIGHRHAGYADCTVVEVSGGHLFSPLLGTGPSGIFDVTIELSDFQSIY